MKIARIFPRRTKATPVDGMAFCGKDKPTGEYDEIHISVAFTYDLPLVENIIKEWKGRGEIKVGGPAIITEEGEFTSGQYLKDGYIITSRGCRNRCWFCSAWRRNTFKELKIGVGRNILDDNILACSRPHIERVFEMLKTQKHIEFTGGLEAKILETWHLEKMKDLKIAQLFFAYDTADDLEPLVSAGKLLKEYNYTIKNRKARAYVLIGYPNDTFANAEKRLVETIKAGMIPAAMLWKNKQGDTDKEWRRFQRQFARVALVMNYIKRNDIKCE